jgi:D-amino-acid dehydrogenase
LISNPDVLVIGGGVIGVCAAYELTNLGCTVSILDRSEIASGSSYGNAGLIVPSHVIPLPRPGVLSQGLKWLLDPDSPFYIRPRFDASLLSWLWQFRQASTARQMRRGMQAMQHFADAGQGVFAELVIREELACDYEAAGLLLLYRTLAGFQAGLEEAGLLEHAGVTAQAMTVDEIRAQEPTVRHDIVGGIYLPADAHLNPAAFVQGLAARVAARGGSICPETTVVGFNTAGGHIVGVRTTAGEINPSQVVLAAGAWSPQIVEELALKLPVQAAKGYSLTYKKPPASPRIPLLLEEARVAVTPMGSRLRFAGMLEFAGLDQTINPRRVAAIAAAPGQYLDLDVAVLEREEVWAGLRPVTPDGLPLIGRAPGWDNLVVATGHAMLGMSLAPVTGKLVADLVTRRPPIFDPYPFRVDRF